MIDWRLQGQEKFLMQVELSWSDYKPYRAGWDHDHCEFCGGKFAVKDGDFSEGYKTKDSYHWVCQNCFNDFKDQFRWEVLVKP